MGGRLEKKIVLVIGGGTAAGGWGNGKAAAVAFAREGAVVVVGDRVLAAAEETAQIIASEGGQAQALAVDLADPASMTAAVDATLARHGRIDVLYNNVGIPGPVTGVGGTALAEWQQVMRVNATGAFVAAKAVLPTMERQGSGVIVNVSSVAGLGVPKVPNAAYGTAKCAMNFLTRSIAIEYAAKGIRANVIAPGLIDTPLVRNARAMVAHYTNEEDMVKKRHAMSPTGRMGSPWDIAAAAVFLASDDAKYVNGVVLPVDGGLSCLVG